MKIKDVVNYKPYVEHEFVKKSQADVMADKIKRKFGYMPEVFKVTPRGKTKGFYVVVEPKEYKPF